MVVHPGDHLGLDSVGEQDRRRRCPSATAPSARPAATACSPDGRRRRLRPASTRPCRTKIRYTVIRDGTGPGQPLRPSSNSIRTRTPPRMIPAQLTHRRLHLRRRLMRTRLRPMRPVLQRVQTVLAIAGQPRMHALPRHPELDRDLTDPVPGPHRQHRPKPLLHHRQLPQCQSRPPTTRRPQTSNDQPAAASTLSSINRYSDVKHQPSYDMHCLICTAELFCT